MAITLPLWRWMLFRHSCTSRTASDHLVVVDDEDASRHQMFSDNPFHENTDRAQALELENADRYRCQMPRPQSRPDDGSGQISGGPIRCFL